MTNDRKKLTEWDITSMGGVGKVLKIEIPTSYGVNMSDHPKIRRLVDAGYRIYGEQSGKHPATKIVLMKREK